MLLTKSKELFESLMWNRGGNPLEIFISESLFLRNIFIHTFVDTDCEYYQNGIQSTNHFPDGECYTGYLWDCMIDRQQVSFNHAISLLQSTQSSIYVFWDIHSSKHILITDYWKYPKEAVLLVAPDELQKILPTLPEDCYFFDNTLSWAIALTHEESKKGRRICYLATATQSKK